MIKLLCTVLLLTVAGMAFASDEFGVPSIPRTVKIDPAEKMLLVENGRSCCVIVVQKDSSKVAEFAAAELQKFLAEATGVKIPIVNKIDPEKVSIEVGSGVDVSKLPRDGFIIKGSGKHIVIAGRDNKKLIPGGKKTVWGDYYERATLFAVYDFLERFAGAKFVFPGKYGTVVPRCKKLEIPAMEIVERPDNIVRTVSWRHGEWFEELPKKTIDKLQRINNYRYRLQTDYIPNNHGLARMAYIERFGESHPEYFALSADGKRSNVLSERMGGQLCFNSGIVEEIYQDAKAFLQGKSAGVRGVRHAKYNNRVLWDQNAARNNFFNVMPPDGMKLCQCSKCRKAAALDKNFAANQVWKMTCDIANRIKKDNISGYITQMAYGKTSVIPPFELPENVLVMTAVTGPWSKNHQLEGWDDQCRLAENWSKKLRNKKIWLWTYVNKRLGRGIPGVTCSTPRAVGGFYSRVKDFSCGSFMESETDQAVFQFFNWYVFGKVMWNKDICVDNLLKETYQALYGKGALDMDKFFNALEDVWLRRITGNVQNTDIGPVTQYPSDHEIWNEIYSENFIAMLDSFLADARKHAANDAAAVERINFIADQYLGLIKKARQKFIFQQNSLHKLKKQVKAVQDNSIVLDGRIDEPGWQSTDVIYLRGLGNKRSEVSTQVRLLRDRKYLYVSVVCEEPAMAETYAPATADDNINSWQHNSVEFFINPDGSRKNYFHFILTQSEAVTDQQYVWDGKKFVRNTGYTSGAEVKVCKQDKSWSLEFAVLLSQLGKIDPENIAADFARNRMLQGFNKQNKHYNWSPYARKYHDSVNFGSLSFNEIKSSNLVANGNFQCVQRGNLFNKFNSSGKAADFQSWIANKQHVLPVNDFVKLDEREFLFDGKSLRIDNPGNNVIFVVQYLPEMSMEKTYRCTFSIKSKLLKPDTRGSISVKLFNGKKQISLLPKVITGNSEWTTYTADFKLDKAYSAKKNCFIRLYSSNFNGTAWFDNIQIEELSE